MHTSDYPDWINQKNVYGSGHFSPASATAPADCEDCIEPIYPTTHVTSQCTDQCVVIACSDPDHNELNECHGLNEDFRCNVVCDGPTHCADCEGLSDVCCPEYPLYPSSHRNDYQSNTPFSWDSSFEDFLCSCTDLHPSTNVPGIAEPFQFPGALGNNSTVQSIHPHMRVDDVSPLPNHSPVAPPIQPPVVKPDFLTCMWGNCNARFASMAELVGHVNLDHLRLPTTPDPGSSMLDSPKDVARMGCQWRDCNIYSSESIPTSSSGNEADEVLNFLSNHLLYDHLGLVGRHDTPTSINKNHSVGECKIVDETQVPESPPPSCQAVHKCRWKSCGRSFTSNESLTQHINSEHIGSGKAEYECFWEGCNRNGSNGFTSKQKICRHLQTHTGHRPYQCQICQQYFSESATLQQHMRRHTQEKPYVCDYPGCGESFAITGALTIHKRIHNGQKPFKCKFCDKAFSESSNLSKHLRTHTGARPYCCSEPGCNKSFARPDQLTRHLGVHRKKPPAKKEPLAIVAM